MNKLQNPWEYRTRCLGSCIRGVLLLKRGVKVSGTDDTGKTALEWAKKRGHKAIIEILSRN